MPEKETSSASPDNDEVPVETPVDQVIQNPDAPEFDNGEFYVDLSDSEHNRLEQLEEKRQKFLAEIGNSYLMINETLKKVQQVQGNIEKIITNKLELESVTDAALKGVDMVSKKIVLQKS